MDVSERILREFSSIAVVGFSRDPSKSAHSIPRAMQTAGYRVLPVNPHVSELLGQPVYKTLADIPEPLELVLVFRPSEEAADIARQAVEAGAKALWLQLGIRSEEARQIAERAGLMYVEDHCIGVERSLLRITKG